MYTNCSYKIHFGIFLCRVESDMWWRFRDWALDHKIKFTESETSQYNQIENEEESIDEEAPQEKEYNLYFDSELPRLFLQSITYFRWKTE